MTKQQQSQKAQSDKTNAVGYSDPTAYRAIRNIAKMQDTDTKASVLVGILKTIAELAGFRITSRFTLEHVQTKQVYK